MQTFKAHLCRISTEQLKPALRVAYIPDSKQPNKKMESVHQKRAERASGCDSFLFQMGSRTYRNCFLICNSVRFCQVVVLKMFAVSLIIYKQTLRLHCKVFFKHDSSLVKSSNFVAPSASANRITAPLALCTP